MAPAPEIRTRYIALGLVAGTCLAAPAALIAQASPAARQLGTVKTVEGSTITIATTAGAPFTVTLAPDATVLQLPPGSTDLKTATPATPASITVGDRILASGKPGDNAASITATRIVLMKSSDIAARNQAQQSDWQKRGIGGIVKSVEGDVITIGSGQRTVKVQTTAGTAFRRYAADSISFQDTKAGALAQVQAGDQLTARGEHSADNSAITAEEVVTGSFQNLSGILTAVNPAAGTVSLKDLATKRDFTVQVTSNSDLRKLPAQAAAAFATRNDPASAAARPAAGAPATTNAEGRTRASMDLSRMLARLPVEPLAEVKPGEAVMIVASQASSAGSLTAITMLTGVEQLLSATGASAQPITLSPWNLSVPEGAGGGGAQ